MIKINLIIFFAFLIKITLAIMPMMLNVGNDTLNHKKYAVFTSNMITGTKNVRWETLPMNYLDSNGLFYFLNFNL